MSRFISRCCHFVRYAIERRRRHAGSPIGTKFNNTGFTMRKIDLSDLIKKSIKVITKWTMIFVLNKCSSVWIHFFFCVLEVLFFAFFVHAHIRWRVRRRICEHVQNFSSGYAGDGKTSVRPGAGAPPSASLTPFYSPRNSEKSGWKSRIRDSKRGIHIFTWIS